MQIGQYQDGRAAPILVLPLELLFGFTPLPVLCAVDTAVLRI
jgi:hypothetical protein